MDNKVKINCNLLTLFFAVLIILLIAFLPNISKAIPNFHLLINNRINYLILLVITLCLLLLDLATGLLFALFILYATVYFNNPNTNYFTDVNNATISNNNLSIKTVYPIIETPHDVKLTPIQPLSGDVPTNMLKGSFEQTQLIEEGFSNNVNSNNGTFSATCANPNNVSQLLFDAEKKFRMEEGTYLPINNNMIPSDYKSPNEMVNQSLDRAGFDTAGCRYDYVKSVQNETMYGPPLSANNYLTKNGVEKTGTVWYPLNP